MARRNAVVVLYRVDIVFVDTAMCAETRLQHARFSGGKRFFTECGKSRWPRWRVPKTSSGEPDRGWARTSDEAWRQAVEAQRVRSDRIALDLRLESARTQALLTALAGKSMEHA